MASIYETQVKLLDEAKKRSIQESEIRRSLRESENTFQPESFTKSNGVAIKDENVTRSLKQSQEKHIKRQKLSRTRAKQATEKLFGKNQFLAELDLDTESSWQDIDNPVSNDDKAASPNDLRNDSIRIDQNDDSLFLQFELERQNWERERAKLITCIELQQEELNKRATAVQSRAVSMAKEFNGCVSQLEERVIAVEEALHNEVSQVRSVAILLKESVAKVNEFTIIDRMDRMERKIEEMTNLFLSRTNATDPAAQQAQTVSSIKTGTPLRLSSGSK